jgi:hypothetical protein
MTRGFQVVELAIEKGAWPASRTGHFTHAARAQNAGWAPDLFWAHVDYRKIAAPAGCRMQNPESLLPPAHSLTNILTELSSGLLRVSTICK